MNKSAIFVVFLLLGFTARLAHGQVQATTGSLANTSILVTLAPGGTATTGFVVTLQPPGAYANAMIRAVGPSLSAFGIKNAAPSPQFRLVGPNGTSGSGLILIGSIDWNATFVASGAFPLAGGETSTGAVSLYGLLPGAYSVQVSDKSGAGGVVLLEVYMNPQILMLPGGPT